MGDITDVRRDELLTRVSTQLVRWNLREPAIMFLAMHEPLAFLGGQMLLAAQPFLGVFTGDAFAHDMALVFQDPESIAQLVMRLEQSVHAPTTP